MNDNKLTKKELHKVIEKRSTGKTSFAEFLDELSNIGVIQYDIDVSTGEVTYKSKHSELKTEPQVNFLISNHFNKDEAIEIIANISLPFLDFLKELANVGIATYTINISNKKATYVGMKGEQIVVELQL
ncbi:DUF1398 family protein [Neobacillus sp. D3-1R]|uniref:DUF1398 family protein n=1 Tax=Neobacillus sp. D3-1R TaxID=3445778 RepID=UPI003F9FD824